MSGLCAVINLFFPSLISLKIYHDHCNALRWSLDDLVAYGIFIVLNAMASRIVIAVINIFVEVKWQFESMEYCILAVIMSLFLSYGRIVVQKVFHGEVEVERK